MVIECTQVVLQRETAVLVAQMGVCPEIAVQPPVALHVDGHAGEDTSLSVEVDAFAQCIVGTSVFYNCLIVGRGRGGTLAGQMETVDVGRL